MQLRFRTDERVTLVGKTGSGKTTFARCALRGVSRLLVLDPKGTCTWVPEIDRYALRALRKGRSFQARVHALTEAEWDEWMWMAFEAGDLVVYIDEVYGVVPPGRRSVALNALLTRGREFGIGVWSATQRPAWCPLVVLSEAEWLVVFRLQLKEDRKRVASIMGEDVEKIKLTGHEFLLYNAEWEKPVHIRRWVPCNSNSTGQT